MDLFFVVVVLVVFAGGLRLLRKYIEGGRCHSKARLIGKTVLVTGANTGIGKETARDLARRACRDTAKAEAAAVEISKTTGSNNLLVVKLDLASLASVRECAKKIKADESRLDILINNAGIMMCPEWKTEDGFEMQLGVNHLGHFLLTNLLLDLIKSSAPARIINVSSIGHQWFGKMCWDDIHMRSNYDPVAAYGQSKLANVLFTRELSKRLKGTEVSAYALHPGNVETELSRYMLDALNLPWRIISRFMATPFGRFMLKTPEQGAQTTIYCAVAEELSDTIGLYFSDCAPANTSKLAQDDDSARRLWELSAEMVSLEKKME
ncbi:retinol dehydrogenase 12-like isoform X2 [Acanthaster planci]|uniref:Retinol dehydrogenase 12-like isoform X2 n=1 Tax=Acanthaster planci TaxID=133434 RepID=A0A8B7ZY00_ACAPL|nr:retinol dehydrogenase 12-like isoform X2 [Acanthaster planci]